MIKKIHVKRCIVLVCMIVLMVSVVSVGFLQLGKKADAAIETLSVNDYCEFAEDEEGAVGVIKDQNGDILWAADFVTDASAYNLVGELKRVLAENTIASKNKEYLTSAESYNLWKGSESLQDSALNVNTTLDMKLQKDVYDYMRAHGVTDGSVLLVDADTGAIRCAVSLPAADPRTPFNELEDGALINKNFTTTIPGSVMKIVTGLLLTEIYPEILEHATYCDGTYEFAENKKPITCITARGSHNLMSALGVSCNCYYADAIVNLLNTNKEVVKERLEALGISCESVKKIMEGGNLSYIGSTAAYTGENSFESIWSLIGEGEVQMSPLDICRIVNGIVKGGTAKTPYLLENVTDAEGSVIEDFTGKNSKITERETAEQFYEIWKTAYDTYYGNDYHSDITVAKTGTAEYANKSSSRTLAGYLEEQNLVFFVEIGDFETSRVMPVKVINYICER